MDTETSVLTGACPPLPFLDHVCTSELTPYDSYLRQMSQECLDTASRCSHCLAAKGMLIILEQDLWSHST